MFKVKSIRSPNKIRDVNIAIAYHNTGRSLKDVGAEFGLSHGSVERIHHGLVRHIARCIGADNVYIYENRGNHTHRMADYLQQYKDFLQGDSMKVEVVVDDLDGEKGVILSVNNCDGQVHIKLADGIDHAEVSLDDLKAALRTLSVK